MAVTYKSAHCGDIDILMVEEEPTYIHGLLPDDGTLVEWGCGGSTIYFLDNLKENQYLVSIEHNKQWYDKISNLIETHPNIDRHVFLYIPSELPNNHYARPEEDMGCGLTEYICPDIDIIQSADVFLVDGIGRGPTAAFLARKAKQDAHVIIHDYQGRELWYDWASNCFDYKVTPENMTLCHMSNTKID
jgi:hypothetical protein